MINEETLKDLKIGGEIMLKHFEKIWRCDLRFHDEPLYTVTFPHNV